MGYTSGSIYFHLFLGFTLKPKNKPGGINPQTFGSSGAPSRNHNINQEISTRIFR